MKQFLHSYRLFLIVAALCTLSAFWLLGARIGVEQTQRQVDVVAATCAVLRPVPLVALMELPVLSVLLSELAGRSTCWMTTLLPPPYFAPTKPPAKPIPA